jgi:hypothetical protein
MEQRPLRLGDTLDDYCPRERRVTNHAVVAMIEEHVKQTRCTTCDAEHPYKGGKAPRRRKKETPAALYKEVLARAPETEPEPSSAAAPAVVEAAPDLPAQAAESTDNLSAAEESVERLEESVEHLDDEAESADARDLEDGPVHRQLIRATLPRPDGQKDIRPVPEFTVRNPQTRPEGFRGDMRTKHRGALSGNGQRPQGGNRFAGGRGGQGRGAGGRPSAGGFRQPRPPRHGGRKRSR